MISALATHLLLKNELLILCKIIHYTKSKRPVGKNRVGGRSLKIYGTVLVRLNINTKNPNKKTDPGKPPLAFAPVAAHPLQPYIL